MIVYQYVSADKTHFLKFVDGENVGGGIVADAEFQAWIAEGNTPEPADPLPPPVYTCSPWQIRKALNNLNLRQQVEDIVATSDSQILKDGWQFATEFRSNDPFVIAMGQEIGKTPEETAELIQYAGTL